MCSIMLGGFTCDHSALPEKEVDFRPHHRKVLWVNSQPKRGTRPQAEASKISAEMPFLREPPGQLSKFQHPAAHLTHAHGLSPSPAPRLVTTSISPSPSPSLLHLVSPLLRSRRKP
jgi:hypothetical protein